MLFVKHTDMRLVMLKLDETPKKGIPHQAMTRPLACSPLAVPWVAPPPPPPRPRPAHKHCHHQLPQVLALSRLKGSDFASYLGKRQYLSDKKDPFEHFSPRAMSIALARALTMAVMPPLHDYLTQLLEQLEREENEDNDDDSDQEEEFQWPEADRIFIDIPQKVRM